MGQWSADRRAAVRASLGVGERPVVLVVARHEHQKGHVGMVAATDLLALRVPDVVVLFAGRDGAATPAIHTALAAHPRAAGTITLLGHRHDVADLMVAADVLCIPSHFEGTAGVSIEAMAMRCPVVCTAFPGIRGILRDGVNALLVPPRDAPALAAALERVLTDRVLATRLADAGVADFDDRFEVHRAAANLEALYRDVVERARR